MAECAILLVHGRALFSFEPLNFKKNSLLLRAYVFRPGLPSQCIKFNPIPQKCIDFLLWPDTGNILIFKILCATEIPGSFIKTQVLGSTSRLSDSADLE